MSLRHFFQHNLGLKIFSLFLATLIWVSIRFGMDNNLHLNLPHNPILSVDRKDLLRLSIGVLTPSGSSGGYTVTPAEVLVSISGDAAALGELKAEDVKAFVDLTQHQQSQAEFHTVRVHLPPGITLLRITPKSVRVDPVVK